MSPRATISSTGRLIVQFMVHVLHLTHLEASAFRRREGHLTRFLMRAPMIMKGAIQQNEWQKARLDHNNAVAVMIPAIIMNNIRLPTFVIEMPYHVW
jgi:hypothetical protein